MSNKEDVEKNMCTSKSDKYHLKECVNLDRNSYVLNFCIKLDNVPELASYLGLSEVTKEISNIKSNLHNKLKKSFSINYNYHKHEFYLFMNQPDFKDCLKCMSNKKLVEIKNILSESKTRLFNFKYIFGAGLIPSNKYQVCQISMLDEAIFLAKKHGEKFYFIDEYKDIFTKNHNIANILKHSIEEEDITPYYQPIVNNKNRKVEKYEALARIEGNVLIYPLDFIETSKKLNLYDSITKIIIRKVLRDFENIDKKVSINISYEDIADNETSLYILDMLKDYKNSSNVVLEIIESDNIYNFNLIKEFITKVKKFGVEISIDDFGTGYSNYMNIIAIDADYVKIDGSIVQRMLTCKKTHELISSIIGIAKKNDFRVIAEFVDSEEIFKELKELGADFSQGFYFGKPLPIEKHMETQVI